MAGLSNALRFFVYAALIALALLLLFPGVSAKALEDVAFAIDPSAGRAYGYGKRHFDARDARDYDLARAAYFFEKANSIDPQYPYLQHERARIAFLAGDFDRASALIDAEIAHHPDARRSYYIRGLIKGFKGNYDGAAKDYETFLHFDPKSWAGINDYSWVLLKADRPRDALVALDWGLLADPLNPWLLNSKATALFELGYLEKAKEASDLAMQAVEGVGEDEWLIAYPGNDPLVAREGVAAFKRAVEENMHTIGLALEKAENNVR